MTSLKFRRVRKLSDQRIMSNWLKEAKGELIERVNQRRGVPRIEIKWRKLHPQVQLWMVIQLASVISLRPWARHHSKRSLIVV